MPLLRRLATWFALAGCVIACAVALMVGVSVVARGMFDTPIPGDVELTQMGIALAIALCLPWCQWRGANIKVDFFTQGARAHTLRVLDGIGCLLLAVMVGLLAWRTAAGALAVRQAQETTMILGLPMWVAYAVRAPGLALTGAIAIAQALRHFKGQPVNTAS
jgi:TRAP-type C4-dicarboxylate transport system permease small subunit